MSDKTIFWTTYKPIDHELRLSNTLFKQYFARKDIPITPYKLAEYYINHYTFETWDDIPLVQQTIITQEIYEKYQEFLRENA